MNRDKFYINGKRGIIMKNNRLLTSFADIKTMRLHNSMLLLDLQDGDEIELIKSTNRSQLKRLAEIISKLTKIDIR